MFFRFVLCLVLAAAGCSAPGDAPMTRPASSIYTTEEGRDAHSYARPAEARVTHVSLDLDLDFDRRIVAGTATLALDVAPSAAEVVLDTRDLRIERVENSEGRILRWRVGDSDPVHGAPLTVELDGAATIRIAYSSSPDAAALQWLTPEQTAGGAQPFMFSQGQAILNRSWIPTQDSPGIRQSWDAVISARVPLEVVMSGERAETGADPTPPPPGNRSFFYRMDDPVPPYLIAIAAGELAFRDIGPRTGVYAEPALVDKAAAEFVDIERMIDAAESLYGPYRWGRYDLLVLPPSFPFGGMENPRLTFATPTILAGDRSLVSLVAHELAHSWSGNLVTNASWNDFWLNEGFTVYFENRIMEAVYGKERAAMLADLGWSDMQADAEDIGDWTHPDTALHLDLDGRDPDEGMTNIAYEKGAVFLRTLEREVGRERFDDWLRGYFERHAFQPQTSAGLIADLQTHLFASAAPPVDLERWVYEPGIPAGAVHVTSDRFAAVDAAMSSFAETGDAAAIPWNEWTTQERQRFLDALPRELGAERLRALDGALGLSQTGNSEVLFSWLKLAIDNRYEPAKSAAERFLSSMGRRKFVAPLFEAFMAEGDWGTTFARDLYPRVRPGYHAITRGTVDEIVLASGP